MEIAWLLQQCAKHVYNKFGDKQHCHNNCVSLGSLPSSFSTVVTALETRVDDLTMDFVQQQLIHHERKLKTQESKSEVLHDSALMGAQKRKLPKCWTCDEVGHIQRFCPK